MPRYTAILIALVLILLPQSSFQLEDGSMIRLKRAVFDPLVKEPSIKDSLSYRPSQLPKLYYAIIQANSPITDEIKRSWIDAGAVLMDYIPENAFIARIDAEAERRLRSTKSFRWLGLYHPHYKLSPSLFDMEPWQPGRYKLFIQLFSGEGFDGAVDALVSAGGEVIELDGAWDKHKRIVAMFDESVLYNAINSVARVMSVEWIEPYPKYTLCNDQGIWICQSGLYRQKATPVWDNGIHGEGQIVAVLDSGCDPDMCYFYDESQGLPSETPNYDQRKIVAYQNIGVTGDWDTHGHGTHTAGTVAGDNFENPIIHDSGDGIAPGAKLVIQDLSYQGGFTVPSSLFDVFQQAYDAGARAHSNSWRFHNSEYGTHAQELDDFVWQNRDFSIIFAMGNEGPSSGTIGSPPVAKNCVSVGATQAGMNAESMTDFSSHGPCQDGRRKPEVSMPGENTVSAGNDGNPDSFNCSTTTMSGTSMATPGVAGCVALVRQYFAEGYYPSGSASEDDAFNPSAALVKAILINSGDNMTGAYTADSGSGSQPIPTNGQGWGRVNLDTALYFAGDRRYLYIDDNTEGLSAFQNITYRIAVIDSFEKLEISLAWNDYPSTPEAQKNLVNDLDLMVQHGMTTYLGNVYSGGQSTPGGSRDTLNNNECVQINNPNPGLYYITVQARGIPQGPQPYALVITGGFRTSDGDISFSSRKFNCHDTVQITVADIDLIGQGTYTVEVTSDSYPQGMEVELVEVSGAGVFKGEFQVAPAGSKDVLPVNEGDMLNAQYIDADDGRGHQNVVKIAQAAIDCTPPLISDIQLSDYSQDKATIKWNTDEKATSIVYYGTTPELGSQAVNQLYTQEHSVTLVGLSGNTFYYYMVASIDEAGNYGSDANDGRYYGFVTKNIIVPFYDSFEFMRGWAQSGDGQWERNFPQGKGGGMLGNPDPDQDHTSGQGKVFGTDLTQDGNYNPTSDCTITSPAIDCRQCVNTELGFFQWLNIGGMSIFGTTVTAQVSNDGANWTTIYQETSRSDLSWNEQVIDISSVADGKNNVRARFRLQSNLLFGDYSGWNIDDFYIRATSNQAAPNTPTPLPTWTPTPLGQKTATPTTTPTATGSISPTLPPTSTRTPTSTNTAGPGTPTNTPLATETPTAPSTITATATATATPTATIPGSNQGPDVWLVGYMDSRLSSAHGGNLVILGTCSDPEGDAILSVDLYYAGQPAGVTIPYSQGIFTMSMPISPGVPSGHILLEFAAIDAKYSRGALSPFLHCDQ